MDTSVYSSASHQHQWQYDKCSGTFYVHQIQVTSSCWYRTEACMVFNFHSTAVLSNLHQLDCKWLLLA